MTKKSTKLLILSFSLAFLAGCAGKMTQDNESASSSSAAAPVAQSASVATPGDQTSLTDTLVKQLGVSEEQAQGGAGAIMQYAKSSMPENDFSQVASAVPDMDNLLGAAPSGNDLGSKALSAVSGSTGSLGSAAGLANAFQQLNLSPDMIGKFVPVITDYVKSYGGEQAASLIQPVLSSLL